MVSFKRNGRSYALGCKYSLTIFFLYILNLGKRLKVRQRHWNCRSIPTNHSLRATTATRGLQKGFPEKFVMERTGYRDDRSLQKYQRPDTSSKIESRFRFQRSSTIVKLSVEGLSVYI